MVLVVGFCPKCLNDWTLMCMCLICFYFYDWFLPLISFICKGRMVGWSTDANSAKWLGCVEEIWVWRIAIAWIGHCLCHLLCFMGGERFLLLRWRCTFKRRLCRLPVWGGGMVAVQGQRFGMSCVTEELSLKRRWGKCNAKNKLREWKNRG